MEPVIKIEIEKGVKRSCNTVLKVKRKKDFPLKDKWCKCGKTKIIEWKTI